MIYEKAMIHTEYERGRLRVSVSGDIDHHSAASLREAIDKALFLYRPAKFELHLGNVDFMDSSGLGLILGRRSVCDELGAKMVLSGSSDQIRRILALAGADSLFPDEDAETRKEEKS